MKNICHFIPSHFSYGYFYLFSCIVPPWAARPAYSLVCWSFQTSGRCFHLFHCSSTSTLYSPKCWIVLHLNNSSCHTLVLSYPFCHSGVKLGKDAFFINKMCVIVCSFRKANWRVTLIPSQTGALLACRRSAGHVIRISFFP